MIVNDTEIVDTVVIGGGQAGLALGRELARQGREFVASAGERRGRAGPGGRAAHPERERVR
jgi:putative flavoprotein involved in K+ transport